MAGGAGSLTNAVFTEQLTSMGRHLIELRATLGKEVAHSSKAAFALSSTTEGVAAALRRLASARCCIASREVETYSLMDEVTKFAAAPAISSSRPSSSSTPTASPAATALIDMERAIVMAEQDIQAAEAEAAAIEAAFAAAKARMAALESSWRGSEAEEGSTLWLLAAIREAEAALGSAEYEKIRKALEAEAAARSTRLEALRARNAALEAALEQLEPSNSALVRALDEAKASAFKRVTAMQAEVAVVDEKLAEAMATSAAATLKLSEVTERNNAAAARATATSTAATVRGAGPPG